VSKYGILGAAFPSPSRSSTENPKMWSVVCQRPREAVDRPVAPAPSRPSSRHLALGRPPSNNFPAPPKVVPVVGAGGGASMGVLGLHLAGSGHLSVPETALPVAAPCAVTISRSHLSGQHPDVSLLSWGWSLGPEAIDFGRPVS